MTHDWKKELVPLPRENFGNFVIPFSYRSEYYYDVRLQNTAAGFSLDFVRLPLDEPHTFSFQDALFDEWKENEQTLGVLQNGAPAALIQTCTEEWNNRLRVTELWISEALRGQGLGRILMDCALERARAERRRALVLETQTSNDHAIGFYLHYGFTPIGCDLISYSNSDCERRSVRLEMGLPLDGKSV